MRQPRKATTSLPTLRDAAAAASSGGAADAAHMALGAGSCAVDAVVAGFFAAAGAERGRAARTDRGDRRQRELGRARVRR